MYHKYIQREVNIQQQNGYSADAELILKEH